MNTKETMKQTTGDWIAQQFFSPDDPRLSPEEYAARHGHEWGCFSYHLYQYENLELGTWVRRVGELLHSEADLERCREKYLTAGELEAVRRYQSEGL